MVFDEIADFFDNFNSHAHVERDLKIGYVRVSTVISTHTLTWSVTQAFENDFNAYSISTHTLTWSVT